MQKRERIIQALLELIQSGKGTSCSVSEIARQAGIGKGSIYYYFSSKEEILDALIDQQYHSIISRCEDVMHQSNENAIMKLLLLFQTYNTACIEFSIDASLHEPEHAYIHQKSLVMILSEMTRIVAAILIQGNEEQLFHCTYPVEFAELILSEFCFVFDYGLFPWKEECYARKMAMIAEVLERGLMAPAGSFDVLKHGSVSFGKKREENT